MESTQILCSPSKILADSNISNFVKVRNFSITSKKSHQTIDTEDAAVTDTTAFAGGEQLDVVLASVRIVAERNTILKVEDGAVGCPYMEVYGVAAVEHGAGGGDVDCVGHEVRGKR